MKTRGYLKTCTDTGTVLLSRFVIWFSDMAQTKEPSQRHAHSEQYRYSPLPDNAPFERCDREEDYETA